jgi:hypothetical protein
MDQNENGGQARPGAEDDGLERPLKRARFGWVGPESHGLSKDQVERYSRQLLVPSFGVAGTFSRPRTPPLCLRNRDIIHEGGGVFASFHLKLCT